MGMGPGREWGVEREGGLSVSFCVFLHLDH